MAKGFASVAEFEAQYAPPDKVRMIENFYPCHFCEGYTTIHTRRSDGLGKRRLCHECGKIFSTTWEQEEEYE